MTSPHPRRCLAALVLAAIASSGGARADEPPATLAEIGRSALATHESVARAESQLRRSQADVRLTRSALLPRLDLNGTYSFYQDEQVLEIAPGESFVLRPLEDWSWSADLRQTLFYGLRDWRANDVARFRLEAAEAQRWVTAADLLLEVAEGFFDATAATEQVQVHRAALALVEEQLRVAERRLQVGEVAPADTARWRAEVAAERQAVVLAEGRAELAHRRLARLAGVPVAPELDPPGPIPVPPGDDLELLALALEQRPEVRALAARLEAAGLMVRLERGAWLPELEAHASYFRQRAPFPAEDWLALSLELKVPIYDGGLTAARVAAAREDLAEVELASSELHKGIADQVDRSAIALRAAEAALAAARERTAAAREAHRQVDRAYRAGEASATDLLDTTSELVDAESSHVIARWQRELQAIALRHAVGSPPLPDVDVAPVEAVP